MWFFAEINTIEYIYQRKNMSTASAPLAAGFTLTGTTVGRETAPISYTVSGPSFGLAIGEQYSLAALSRIRQTTAPDGKIEVYIDNLLLKRFDTSGEAASVVVSINQAVGTISRSIQQQATNTNTTSSNVVTTVTSPNEVTVLTEAVTTTTSGGSRTITVPPTVPAPNAAPTTTPPRTSPQTTTNPSNASLPLGDAIDDIYDPNLTPEQIASLSPGDRRARENFFIEEAGGTPNTDGLGEVEEDGTIVVTAPGEDDEIVVNGGIDWRVRLSLAQDSTYFYNNPDAGILKPLVRTNGVIFPYTPAININYLATYEPASIVHNNYKVFQYSNSSVDSVTITCDFTAQDDGEANYMLAVIHFFRSLTKMFFGQDQQPRAGTPPPLCYLSGIGTFQFNNHPLAVSSFAYNLPNDVDYISTDGPITMQAPTATNNLSSSLRLPPNIVAGGVAAPPMFENRPRADSRTWVPTKMQMVITCIPIMSRNEVSNEFSLREYSNGSLIDRGYW